MLHTTLLGKKVGGAMAPSAPPSFAGPAINTICGDFYVRYCLGFFNNPQQWKTQGHHSFRFATGKGHRAIGKPFKGHIPLLFSQQLFNTGWDRRRWGLLYFLYPINFHWVDSWVLCAKTSKWIILFYDF